MSVSDALNMRGALVNLMSDPVHGAGISGFTGAGLSDKIREGSARLVPVAYSSLDNAIKGFAKGFTEKEGELQEKGVAGLTEGLKAGGKALAEGIATELGKPAQPSRSVGSTRQKVSQSQRMRGGDISGFTGASISGFTGAGQPTAGLSGVASTASTRKLARPRI